MLNGCQTIKTSFYFLNNSRFRGRIDQEVWKRICMPLRIITTGDERFIRQITIGNNRRNQISPAALLANDPERLELAARLRRHGTFYQQEGAFEELEETSPGIIEGDYPKTNNRYVGIEDLARCVAATAAESTLITVRAISSKVINRISGASAPKD